MPKNATSAPSRIDHANTGLKLAPDTKELKLAYSILQAAEACGVSSRTLYRSIDAKKLPIVKIGSRTLIRVIDLEQFLAEHLAA